jgi:hypothetical protein
VICTRGSASRSCLGAREVAFAHQAAGRAAGGFEFFAGALEFDLEGEGPRMLPILEELDDDEVVMRIQATPEYATDGARLAHEILVAMTAVAAEPSVASEAQRFER